LTPASSLTWIKILGNGMNLDNNITILIKVS
jgi:hypothetical protein